MTRSIPVFVLAVLLLFTTGCKKEEEASTDYTPRDRPALDQSATTRPAGEAAASPHPRDVPGLPDGHPSILPQDHPPIPSDLAPGGEITSAEPVMPFSKPPDAWELQPPRQFTTAVYALPSQEGDPKDTGVFISSLGRQIPFDMNKQRWCGQFRLPEGKTCDDVGVRELEGTEYPTTIVDVSGTYTSRSLRGAAGEPKENYRMLAAEVRMPQGPWYAKLIGPAASVGHWEDEFITFVRSAM
jgi:hypothetical protein